MSQRRLPRVTPEQREVVTGALANGLLSYRGLVRVTRLDRLTARRSLQSCVDKDLVYRATLQRPRRNLARRPKRPMTVFGTR